MYTAAFIIKGILLSHTIPDISRHFPQPAPTRRLISYSQRPFSLIIEPRHLNVSTCSSLSFLLSDISTSTPASLVHTMTYVFFAFTLPFTLVRFFSNASSHSTTLLCNLMKSSPPYGPFRPCGRMQQCSSSCEINR